MIREIHLHGELSKFSSEPILLDVDSPALMISGLNSAFPKFRKSLMNLEGIYVFKLTPDTIKQVENHTWSMPFGDAEVIHIIPKIEGEWTAILGWAVNLGYGMYATYAIAAVAYIAVNVAVAYALASVAAMLAPSPEAGGSERADEKPSFIFNGATNVIEQGYPVPLVYGEIITGSVVISVATEVEDIIAIPEYDIDFTDYYYTL